MESFLKSLRNFYLFASIPPLAFFALFYLAEDGSLVSQQTSYILLMVLYVLALVGIPATSIYLRRTASRCEDKPDDEAEKSFGLAYKVRLVVLNVLSFMSGMFYFITAIEGCIYMVGILSIVVLLSYPSRQYVMHGKE